MNIFVKLFSKRMQFTKNMAEFQKYVSLNLTCAFAITPHIFYLVYFYLIGIYPLSIFNFFSICYYLFGFWLIKRGKYDLFGILTVIEIILFSITSTITLGIYFEFHWYIFVAVLPFFLFLESTSKQKLILGVVAIICFNFLLIRSGHLEPIYLYSDRHFFIKLLNVNLVVIACVMELLMDTIAKTLTTALHYQDIQKYKEQAYIDHLTKLQNRNYAEVYFDKLLKTADKDMKICFTMIDIDYFKNVNDMYGHEAGDMILSGIGSILNNCFRQTDLISRWGGEEFLVVIMNVGIETARKILNNLLREVEESVFTYKEHEIKVTITVGVAECIDFNFTEAIARCDEYLYIGKNNGRNQVVACKL